MKERLKSLFEELLSLLEADDTAVFRRTALFIFITKVLEGYSMDTAKKLVDDFLNSTVISNRSIVDKFRNDVLNDNIGYYLDNPNSSSGRLMAQYISFLTNEHNVKETFKGCFDYCVKFDDVYKSLRAVNFKFFPICSFYSYTGLPGFKDGTDNLVSAAELVLKGFKYTQQKSNCTESLLSSIPDDVIQRFVSVKQGYSYIGSTSKDLLEVFYRVEDFFESNKSYSAIQKNPYGDGFKWIYPLNQLISFSKAILDNDGKDGEKTLIPDKFVTDTDYTVHYCRNAEELRERVEGYNVSWCAVGHQVEFDSYTRGGIFIVFIKEGAKSIRRSSRSRDYKKDKFALSLIAVAFDPMGGIRTVTSRRNNGDQYLSKIELEEVVGIKVSDLDVVDYEKQQLKFDVFDNVLRRVVGPYTPVVVVPEGVEIISSTAFRGKGVLTGVVLPDSIKELSDCAFEDRKELREINFPQGLEGIKNDCFSGSSLYGEIVIPSSVTKIGKRAFAFCNYLEKAIIKSKKLNVLESIFYSSKGLKEVEISSVETLDGTFSGCSKLKSVVLPNDLKNIRFGTFWGCSSLKELNIPESCESIDSRVFCGAGIESLHIPRSVKHINALAFDRMYNLKSFKISPENKTYKVKDQHIYENGKVLCTNPAFEGTLTLSANSPYEKGEIVGVSGIGRSSKLVFDKSVTKTHEMNLDSPNLEEIVFKSKRYIRLGPEVDFSTLPNLRRIVCEGLGIKSFGKITDCPKLSHIDFADSVLMHSYHGILHIRNCPSLTNPLVSKGGKTLILMRVFKDSDNVIPDGVERIMPHCFRFVGKGSKPVKIVIPASVKLIEHQAFDLLKSKPELIFKGSKSSIKGLPESTNYSFNLLKSLYSNGINS